MLSILIFSFTQSQLLKNVWQTFVKSRGLQKAIMAANGQLIHIHSEKNTIMLRHIALCHRFFFFGLHFSNCQHLRKTKPVLNANQQQPPSLTERTILKPHQPHSQTNMKTMWNFSFICPSHSIATTVQWHYHNKCIN